MKNFSQLKSYKYSCNFKSLKPLLKPNLLVGSIANKSLTNFFNLSEYLYSELKFISLFNICSPNIARESPMNGFCLYINSYKMTPKE